MYSPLCIDIHIGPCVTQTEHNGLITGIKLNYYVYHHYCRFSFNCPYNLLMNFDVHHHE